LKAGDFFKIRILTMSFRSLVAVHGWQAGRLGPRPALRYRGYGTFHDVTWAAYRENARACAAALVEAGVMPGDRIGLLAENRVEWLLADMGIMTAGAVNVPAHSGIPAGPAARLFGHAEISWLFVSTAAQLDKARDIRKELPAIRGVVVFDRTAATDDAPSWAGFLQHGRQAMPRAAAELDRREEALSRDDLATIMYTSGTTGNPKGVMLTHGNLLSNAEAMLDLVKDEEVVLLSWLPYSHIFARLCDYYLSLCAGLLVVLSESVDALPLDLPEVRPTHLHGVPRFWEKMLAAAQAYPDPAKALRFMFGNRIKWLMSGGAALPPKIAEAYHRAGLPLIQGYGLTETSPVLTNNRLDNFRIPSAGRAIPGVELCIAEDGEILARGPNIMKGYWKQPDATAAVMRDGWFCTGDVGRIDADGFLYITGRKKDMLVLSNGKKVAPTEVEAMLLSDPHLEQAVVFGDGKSCLTAIVVPNWAKVRQSLSLNGSEEELARNPSVKQFLRSRIDAAMKDTASWEQIKEFIVRPQPFGIERGEMTVSLKLKRETIFQHHASELQAAYQQDHCAT
jgi:long-chain acyl-CoA synthetase